MEVDFANMSLAQQVLARQQAHAAATGRHLDAHAHLSQADLGLVLQLLHPLNETVANAGSKIAGYSSQVFEVGADKMAQTVERYQSAERTAHEALAKVGSSMGVTFPPYTPASPPMLGSAASSAPPRYGEPDGNVFNQAFWDGYRAAEWSDETADDIGKRVRDGMAAHRSVSEAVDASSFLVTPVANEPELENIRWKFGVILGGVDWVFEQIAGFSFLEKITKPFTGDWSAMNRAAISWTHAGDAMNGISRNTAAILPGMASWTGKGSEAFLITAGVVSQGHAAIAGPAGTISLALKGLAFAAKQAVSLIVKFLKWLAEKLASLASKMSVPVLGWAAAALEAGLSIPTLIKDCMKAYKTVNILYDLISSMSGKVSGMVDNVMRMADIYEAVGRGAATRA